MSVRYFIIGSNGQLGTALTTLKPDATAVDRNEFDMTDPAAYETVDWSNYDVIVNAAGMTDVDGAETSEGRKLAWSINAEAVGLLSTTTLKHSLPLVHVSTDYVFDGTVEPHTEDESFNPLSVYGQSKAAGDIAAAVNPRHYILRTSWVIGSGKNFISIMESLAEKGIKPNVVDDQIGRLTFAMTLARAIVHLVDNDAPYGTYNCTNNGDSVSWADIAKLVFEHSGASSDDVSPVSTEEYYLGKDGIAPRPLKSTLDLDKLQKAGFTPNDWRDELQMYWKGTE